MSKDVTCGIIFRTRLGQILLVHPTGANEISWSLPKGIADPGEDHSVAACRELMEETGVLVNPDQLIDLGTHAYRPDKDYHIFQVNVWYQIFTRYMVCKSTFRVSEGVYLPEVDDFKLATPAEAEILLNRHQAEIFKKVFRV